MSEKHKMSMRAVRKDGFFEEQAEAYVYAVGVLRDTLLALEAAGVAPNERCDALGYTLINLLTDHYPAESGLLLFETLQSTLKACYDAGLASASESTTSVFQH